NLVRGGAVKGISLEQLKKVEIPVPPIETQNKISKLLDSLIQLKENLEQELILRKHQFKHYLDKLISVNKNTKTIQEISTDIYRGNGIRKEHIGSGKFPYIFYGELYTKYGTFIYKPISTINPDLIKKKRYCQYGDLLITSTGEKPEEIAKTCAYLSKEKCIAGWGLFVLKHNQNPKYLAYALSTAYAEQQKQTMATKSTIAYISTDKFIKIKIPIPSL
ncbi:putative restriction-modification system protein, partial [Candidatus Mycoplasma haematohominis]